MSDQTSIAWTSATWNPVRGCAPISPGCAHCYAARMASRFAGPGRPYDGLANNGKWTGRARFVPDALDLPLRWRKPRRVFVNSMSDLFHDDVTDEQIASVFGVMSVCQRHTFQILTKRPARMVQWFRWADNFGHPHAGVAASLCLSVARFSSPKGRRNRLENIGPGWPWPLPNVWIGVSAEDQARADERIPLLLQTPAAVRFVSCEPLLGEVQFVGPAGAGRIDWVIVGGESGPRARPCSVSWVRAIVGQCKTAGVPVFIKQLGANAIDSSLRDVWCHGEHHYTRAPGDPLLAEATGRPGYEVTDHRLSRLLRDPSGADPSEWPSDLRVRDWPREARP